MFNWKIIFIIVKGLEMLWTLLERIITFFIKLNTKYPKRKKNKPQATKKRLDNKIKG